MGPPSADRRPQRNEGEQRLAMRLVRRAELLDRLVGVLDVPEHGSLREGRQVVVVSAVARLLQVTQDCRDVFDRCTAQRRDEGSRVLWRVAPSPRDPLARLLERSVGERTRELQPVLGACIRNEVLRGLPSQGVEERVVGGRDGTPEPNRPRSSCARVVVGELAGDIDQPRRVDRYGGRHSDVDLLVDVARLEVLRMLRLKGDRSRCSSSASAPSSGRSASR